MFSILAIIVFSELASLHGTNCYKKLHPTVMNECFIDHIHYMKMFMKILTRSVLALWWQVDFSHTQKWPSLKPLASLPKYVVTPRP
jgi:hypothetical protein